jgi:hypothetical protein
LQRSYDSLQSCRFDSIVVPLFKKFQFWAKTGTIKSKKWPGLQNAKNWDYNKNASGDPSTLAHPVTRAQPASAAVTVPCRGSRAPHLESYRDPPGINMYIQCMNTVCKATSNLNAILRSPLIHVHTFPEMYVTDMFVTVTYSLFTYLYVNVCAADIIPCQS